MTEQEPLQFLIPRRIDQGYQFFPGWGFRQVSVVLAGLAVGAMLALVAHVLHATILYEAAPLFIGGGAGVMVARPLMDGSTVLDLLTAYRSWSRRPKLYLYDWARDDWPE